MFWKYIPARIQPFESQIDFSITNEKLYEEGILTNFQKSAPSEAASDHCGMTVMMILNLPPYSLIPVEFEKCVQVR